MSKGEPAYYVEIQDKIETEGESYDAVEQIGASVYEIAKRSHDSGEQIRLLLDHTEDPVSIGGRSQAAPRRPDGGYTWYHNNTACYTRATPQETSFFNRDHRKLQREWADHVQKQLTGIGYSDEQLRYGGAGDVDIYAADPAGKKQYDPQLVGLSMRVTEDVTVERACWYEEDPFVEAFNALLVADGINPADFRDGISVLDSGLLSHLEAACDVTYTPPETFLSENSLQRVRELQQDGPEDVDPVSCVLGETYDYQPHTLGQ